ncbi:MAG: 50S ribosomal protein L22 [Candidatus Krumholzibacteriota bacterium]|nr:50S ribosomal protein L22 [Candidatus Krumholzibacteriota bacterium]
MARRTDRRHGFRVSIRLEVNGTSGRFEVVGEPSESPDYVLNYIDKWYWDMRTYRVDFRVDVRDTETNMLVGSGRSFQASIDAMGHTYEEIVESALDILRFTSRVAAATVSKTIQSAMHNMVNQKGGTVDAEDIYIKSINVDEGRTLYRIRPRAQGRAFRIRKRSSHIKVVVSLLEGKDG